MFEFILGAFLSWWAIGVFLLLAVFSEYHDSNWAFVFLVVASLSAFFIFNVNLKDLLVMIPVYIAVGVVWSFWRYKRYVDKQLKNGLEQANQGDITPAGFERIKENLNPTSNLGRIVNWILIWPISLVENLTADILKVIELLVTTVFKSAYHKIYESAIGNYKLEQGPKNDSTGK